MYEKTPDTPTRPGNGLSHIVVQWKAPNIEKPVHLLYDAIELGETVARQRAATRAALHRDTIIRYRAYYLDNRTEDLAA